MFSKYVGIKITKLKLYRYGR